MIVATAQQNTAISFAESTAVGAPKGFHCMLGFEIVVFICVLLTFKFGTNKIYTSDGEVKQV